MPQGVTKKGKETSARLLKKHLYDLNRYVKERETLWDYYNRNFLDIEASDKGSPDHDYYRYIADLMDNRSAKLRGFIATAQLQVDRHRSDLEFAK